ncbi:MAG: LLM class flavin-dependent oxidoreductase [Porticoccaceae bacterium]|jgi:alkanesulfonate monooxygenase SsuD/methylene tetrahydromethanopterin reductase-like flavin-dependent oxidoreductase (luciferase family)|nr:LLM class flavin-dependent oxidoreductase [Paracoccaceae bacterium]MDG1243126.1 LLM class flavin-dependent oxidoreductase [Porticoccaceae bacterium]MDG1323335.1 LLM class flavin-dependent oxidoreductase [Porticoccaceae bacterium]MDG2145114.1 LLM class flavin-dependent oxidoreductase [Porticoccaceae bacterium]HAT53030.1 LLM class flavin-dependent oxidoreductase [Betaproteobacteria bacterium]|tara:strand:- start:3793 stop:4881 length:1089 start_codon:yes stop_codon:yes gene_type:complete
MDLSFFTMPLHPVGKPVAQSIKEDREAFILADSLGFKEGYCGEHTTDLAENITSTVAFMASLAYETKNIRLGTGTVNLPNSHPARVAAEISMLDHMTEGRLNFGISPGGLLSDSEIFGNLDKDRNAMFLECINMVLDIWAGEAPYNLKGDYFEVSTERTMLPDIGQGSIIKPYQDPHPPIVGTVVAPFSKGVTAMAARGWEPISANFLLPKWVKTHWPNYAEGCELGGRAAEAANWRIAKNICVADDMKTAKQYARGENSPYVLYYRQLLTKLKDSGRLNLFKEDQEMSDDEVTLDYVLDRLVIHGDASSVADQVLAFREEVGDFGHLVYAGHDWTDYELGRKSMILTAEKVMPIINDAIKS